MEELGGEPAHGPPEPVTVECVDSRLPDGELVQLFDVLLPGGARVVASSGGEGLHARNVRQNLGGVGHLGGVERKGASRLRQGPPALEGDEPEAPELARRRFPGHGLLAQRTSLTAMEKPPCI